MNPMSLLTLPADALREASLHEGVVSPRGERRERAAALSVAVLMLVLGLAAMFAA